MKRIIISAIILSSTLLYSCQEVIEIDLNSSNPVIVVDGEISIGEPAQVQLSYTSDYFATEEQQNIENALVTLNSSDGEIEELVHIGDGNYAGSSIFGKDNTQYELQIEIDNTTLKGSSGIMSDFSITNINTVETVINRPGFAPGGSDDSIQYNVELVFTDDSSQENSYLLQILTNGQVGEFQTLLITDQQYKQNGSITYNPMMYQFSVDDTVQIRIASIDTRTYEFYNQLSDVSGSGGMQAMMNSGTPYNPTSNMGNNVMGYFAAFAIVDTTIIIQ